MKFEEILPAQFFLSSRHYAKHIPKHFVKDAPILNNLYDSYSFSSPFSAGNRITVTDTSTSTNYVVTDVYPQQQYTVTDDTPWVATYAYRNY